jgi:pre-mRNA-processing factor 40
MSLFENDQRFKAVDRPRDREDLFDNYIVELERKVTIRLFRGAFVFIC